MYIYVFSNRKPHTWRTQVQRAGHAVPAGHTGLTLSSMCDSSVRPWVTGHGLNRSLRAGEPLGTRSPRHAIGRGGCNGSLHTVISAIRKQQQELENAITQ